MSFSAPNECPRDRRERPRDSISVVIPAHNEEPRLVAAIREVLSAVRDQFADFELIIVEDASSDRTPEIADELAREHDCVRVIHLPPPNGHGLGGAFKAGLRQATKEYVSVAHGDGGTSAAELIRIWAARGEADLVIPYMLNDDERPPIRLAISRAFRFTVNRLFGIRVRCHGHYVLYRREWIQGIRLRTDGHAFQAEAVIKLLRAGHSFVEVGVCDDFENQAPTRSYTPRNILRILWFFATTAYDVYLAAPRPLPKADAAHTARRGSSLP